MALWHWLLAHTRESMRGQGLVEYALLIIFVAVVLIALLTILGPGIQDIFQNIIDHI
jgi:pilus assembly protein Flp/PilA